MIEGHGDTIGGGLTSGHIRSLDVNNDCMAGGLDEHTGDLRTAVSIAYVLDNKETAVNCLDLIHKTTCSGGKDLSKVIATR